MDENVNIDEAIASIRNLISSSYGADKNLMSIFTSEHHQLRI
jgi:hypothetical protein